MGRYLVPELINRGYAVDVVAKDAFESTCDDLRYIIGDAMDVDYMRELLKNGYDRLFDRIIDNSKILDVAGMKQEELMPLKEGLRYEISKLPRDIFSDRISAMDKWFIENNIEYKIN